MQQRHTHTTIDIISGVRAFSNYPLYTKDNLAERIFLAMTEKYRTQRAKPLSMLIFSMFLRKKIKISPIFQNCSFLQGTKKRLTAQTRNDLEIKLCLKLL